jgi:hypothetical protein
MMLTPARRKLLRFFLVAVLPFAFVSQTLQAADASPPVTVAAQAPDLTEKFLQAAQKFEEARAGSAAAVAPAQAAFKALLAADPSNPLFMAYYGSTFAMQARDGGAPWQKIGRVHESIENIDRALSLLGPQHDTRTLRGVPISLETRLVAIATYVPLPSLFNRMDVARQQLAIVLGSPLFASASTELRGRFLYEDALIARADGDSEHERRSLREVLNYAPPSLNLNEVRGELAKLGG